MLKAFLIDLALAVLKHYIGIGREDIQKLVDEKAAKKADDEKAQQAVDDLRKPHQTEEELEDAFDRFRNKLD